MDSLVMRSHRFVHHADVSNPQQLGRSAKGRPRKVAQSSECLMSEMSNAQQKPWRRLRILWAKRLGEGQLVLADTGQKPAATACR